MHSIRTRIIAVTVAAVLVSVMAFAMLAYVTVGNESQRTSAAEMNLIARNVQLTLDEYLGSVRQSVEMAAHFATEDLDPVLLVECGAAGSNAGKTPRTKEQTEKLDAFLAKHSTLVQEAFHSVASHTSGVITYYYCIATDISENEHGFFYSRLGNSGFVEQEPLDARDLDPEDRKHTTWYYTPIEHGHPCWVGPYTAHYLGEVWTVSYLVPIYKANKLIGVLGMDILFETLQEKVDEVTLYDSGYACLLNEDGTVLDHPVWEIGSRSLAEASLLHAEILRNENSGDEVYPYENEDGVKKQLAFSTLSNGMKVIVTAPSKEVNTSWRWLMVRTLVASLAVLVIFAVIMALIVRHLTKPLKQLSEASARLAAGDYDAELDYEADNEVGQLTKSFQEMRDRMRLYIRDLNSKAYTDALTRVKNKAAFEIYSSRMAQTIQAAKEDEMPEFGIVMFDCNELKAINDAYGHERGNEYLITACRLICGVFSHSPVFRMGGDEFVVLLTGQDYENRTVLMQDFDLATEKHNKRVENPWERISLAKGIAAFIPGSDRTVQQVLERADKRMYEEKRRFKGETEVI